jgi:ribose/xylose/arabinose/galactoside ABC-type transport system permease subunit
MTGLRLSRIILLVVVGILVMAGFAASDITIISRANLSSMAVFAVEVGLIAFGQTLVICGGDGAIDLSVGAISGLAQVVLGLMIEAGIPWPIAILGGLVAGAFMGLINGVAVTRFRIPPIIVTLATMFAFSGLALVATGGINIDLTSGPASFLAIGQGTVGGLPFQVMFVYLPIFVIFALLQHRSLFGRSLYLTGTNALAAHLSGIHVNRVRAMTYVLAGLLSGVAGIVGAARLGTASPDGTDQANLISIAIVVLGGASIFGGDGSVVGTLVATVVIAIADYGLSYNNYNPIYQAGVMGLILVVVVLLENALANRWIGSRRKPL